jgi:SAM-dependent methyltransferase
MKTFIDSHTLGQESTWFSDWFDSPYYHLLYRNRDEQEARFFMDNLANALQFLPTHSILDVACGKGRHAKYLNSKGLRVTGIDLSKESIAEANQSANERLQFLVHDMREIYAEDCFDFVLNMFTSFGYFESETENLTAIQSMATSLHKGGKLVIDFFNPHKVIRELIPIETKRVEDITFHITRHVQNGFIVKQIAFEHKGQHHHFEEKVKAIDLDEFMTYCSFAGLHLSEIFGNYSLEPYHEQESDRLIIIAEKR